MHRLLLALVATTAASALAATASALVTRALVTL
jgi:hypothetical protein